MKRTIVFLLALVLLLCACGRAEDTVAPVLSAPPTISSSASVPLNRTVRITVTEMLGDSDAFQMLCTLFEQETGYRADVSVNTDSTAVSVAETGKIDVLIAQKGTDVSRFLKAGYADSSLDWLSGGLVIAGPKNDPANISDADTAVQAFIRIAKTGSSFVSCYDDSDVSRFESRIWANAGIAIGNGKKWYKALRLSMKPALFKASELSAYILADQETYLQNVDQLDLTVFMLDDPVLQTTFCVLPVSADRFPTVNQEGADAWLTFLQTESARSFLQLYGTDSYGSPIFKILN